MRSTFKPFLILITLTVFVYAWRSHQLGNFPIQLLIVVLMAVSLAVFFTMSLLDRKSGLSWGGGYIKVSEATRETKRKFLGR